MQFDAHLKAIVLEEASAFQLLDRGVLLPANSLSSCSEKLEKASLRLIFLARFLVDQCDQEVGLDCPTRFGGVVVVQIDRQRFRSTVHSRGACGQVPGDSTTVEHRATAQITGLDELVGIFDFEDEARFVSAQFDIFDLLTHLVDRFYQALDLQAENGDLLVQAVHLALQLLYLGGKTNWLVGSVVLVVWIGCKLQLITQSRFSQSTCLVTSILDDHDHKCLPFDAASESVSLFKVSVTVSFSSSPSTSSVSTFWKLWRFDTADSSTCSQSSFSFSSKRRFGYMVER